MPICHPVPVDTSLLRQWKRQQAARIGARNTLPSSWRDDPRPEMQVVTDAYVELLARIKQQKQHVHAIPADDR
jgi:hypothetical protein